MNRKVGKLLTAFEWDWGRNRFGAREVVTQHVPSKINDVADKLSRLAQPGASQQLPPQLQEAKRRVTPKRDDAFFSSWAGAVGLATTAQVGI